MLGSFEQTDMISRKKTKIPLLTKRVTTPPKRVTKMMMPPRVMLKKKRKMLKSKRKTGSVSTSPWMISSRPY